MNTLVRGQKLPIFSGSGIPHPQFATQIARQARMLKKEEKFAVVFAATGITFEKAEYFISDFKKTGALRRTILFINLADDPPIERIALPRSALTCAEYLAFELEMHVLVILTDLTNYCEALREISAARKEIPGRRGYPGYLYTDLATIYERPDLPLPRPAPEGIYPPVDVLPSLSRLKDKGIGKEKTREDHSDVLSQLFAAYAWGKEAQELAVILGESALTPVDLQFVAFAETFEDKFVRQREDENRDIIETLDTGWRLMSKLPASELKRIRDAYKEKYLKPLVAHQAVQ